MKPQTVWVALSAQGHPAPFVGYAFQRKMLAETYRQTYGHDIERAGYQLVKAELVIGDRQRFGAASAKRTATTHRSAAK